MKKYIYQFNLSHLVKKIEQNFNTVIPDYGVVKNGSLLSNELTGNDFYDFEFLGYLVVPVDDECEYIITNTPPRSYDLSDFRDSYEAQKNIIHLDFLINFFESEFQGRLYPRKVVNVKDAGYRKKIIPHIADSDKYLTMIYLLA